MSPFCTRRLVGKLCAPSVLIPDCNQDQAEIKRKKGYEIFFVKRSQKQQAGTVRFEHLGGGVLILATIMDLGTLVQCNELCVLYN